MSVQTVEIKVENKLCHSSSSLLTSRTKTCNCGVCTRLSLTFSPKPEPRGLSSTARSWAVDDGEQQSWHFTEVYFHWKLHASAVSLQVVFRDGEPLSSVASNVVSLWLVAKYDEVFLMLVALKCGILIFLFVALTVANEWQRHLCKQQLQFWKHNGFYVFKILHLLCLMLCCQQLDSFGSLLTIAEQQTLVWHQSYKHCALQGACCKVL